MTAPDSGAEESRVALMVPLPEDPFADVPATPRGHLGLAFYAAVADVLAVVARRAAGAGRPWPDALAELPALHGYWQELCRRLPACRDPGRGRLALACAIAAWEQRAAPFLPLQALRADGVDDQAVRVLALLGLVEEDPAFGDLFAALQPTLGQRRPAVALLGDLCGGDADGSGDGDGSRDGSPWPAIEALAARGLVEPLSAGLPRSEWTFRVPAAIWAALRGDRPARPAAGLARLAAATVASLDELVLGGDERQRLAAAARLLGAGQADVLVLRGPAGRERREAVAAVARALGRDVLIAAAESDRPGGPPGEPHADPHTDPLALLGSLALLTRALPVFELELAPSDTFTVPALGAYPGPLAVIAGAEGGIAATERTVTVDLAADPPERRREHWRRALGAFAGGEIERIATTFTLSGRHIRAAASLATGQARLDNRTHVVVDDVRAAVRTLARHRLETLASPLPAEPGGWDRLVVPEPTLVDLRLLESRCCHRERLSGSLVDDFPGGLNRGVRALLEGPSGTGKTLAVRVLAGCLGLDLYRVDLAAIVNKYVGETEKNLARLLARAEDLDVILLLDEGDAVMARRTEVRSANDRYANLETNYLLQRLETYTGIIIVTTNMSQQIDPAFRRRMDITVRFHTPDAEERWRLWLAHLSPSHGMAAAAIEQIAVAYPLSGGQIRNAVATATLAAVARQGRLDEADLLAAIAIEHRKAGAASAVTARIERGGGDGGLAGFLGVSW